MNGGGGSDMSFTSHSTTTLMHRSTDVKLLVSGTTSDDTLVTSDNVTPPMATTTKRRVTKTTTMLLSTLRPTPVTMPKQATLAPQAMPPLPGGDKLITSTSRASVNGQSSSSTNKSDDVNTNGTLSTEAATPHAGQPSDKSWLRMNIPDSYIKEPVDVHYKVKASIQIETEFNVSWSQEYMRVLRDELTTAYINVSGIDGLTVSRIWEEKNNIFADYYVLINQVIMKESGQDEYDVITQIRRPVKNYIDETLFFNASVSAAYTDLHIDVGLAEFNHLILNPSCSSDLIAIECQQGFSCVIDTAGYKCLYRCNDLDCKPHGECALNEAWEPVCKCDETDDVVYSGPLCKDPVAKLGMTREELVTVGSGIVAAIVLLMGFIIFTMRGKLKKTKKKLKQEIDKSANASTASSLEPPEVVTEDVPMEDYDVNVMMGQQPMGDGHGPRPARPPPYQRQNSFTYTHAQQRPPPPPLEDVVKSAVGAAVRSALDAATRQLVNPLRERLQLRDDEISGLRENGPEASSDRRGSSGGERRGSSGGDGRGSSGGGERRGSSAGRLSPPIYRPGPSTDRLGPLPERPSTPAQITIGRRQSLPPPPPPIASVREEERSRSDPEECEDECGYMANITKLGLNNFRIYRPKLGTTLVNDASQPWDSEECN